MKKITNSSVESLEMAREFAKSLTPGDVVLMYGDLGAGKTTFVQGLASGLGIKDRILSPTFVLQRSHLVEGNSIKNLNHIDLYRIENPTEVESLGLTETVSEEGSVSVIEWAERLKNFRPKKGFYIRINHLEGDKREIEIVKI